MPATGQTIRIGDIVQGSPQATQSAWRAMARLQEKYDVLLTKFDAVLAKLDADAGVTDTNYAALQGSTIATSAVVTERKIME